MCPWMLSVNKFFTLFTLATRGNYLGLLDVLQKVRYFDPVQRRCLRSSDEYDAIFCPEGYVKRSAEQVFCSDCPDTYSCLCSPCAKLRDPEFVLKVELLSTSWKGNVDLEQVANSTVLANSCERMTVSWPKCKMKSLRN